MSIAGIHQDASGLLAMQNLMRDSKSPNTNSPAAFGETQRQALQLLANEKPGVAGLSWPVPMPEQAQTYAPRPGIEAIKETAAEILRAAQAIPREDSGDAQQTPRQPSLDKSV